MCRRKDILRLKLEDYQAVADEVTAGFAWTAQFLAKQKIFRARDIPDRTQLVPLGGASGVARQKAESCGEQMSSAGTGAGCSASCMAVAIKSYLLGDVEQVPAWLSGGPEPRTVADAAFETSRLFTLRTRNSAA